MDPSSLLSLLGSQVDGIAYQQQPATRPANIDPDPTRPAVRRHSEPGMGPNSPDCGQVPSVIAGKRQRGIGRDTRHMHRKLELVTARGRKEIAHLGVLAVILSVNLQKTRTGSPYVNEHVSLRDCLQDRRLRQLGGVNHRCWYTDRGCRPG